MCRHTQSHQSFDPWGQIKSGAISATTLNYTGQRLDGTGLLYYHARMEDPVLARFVSADSVVPGASAMTMGPDKASNGPADPQQLNRFSYVSNNPVKNTDPTGHWLESAIDIASIAYDVYDISQNGLTVTSGLALAADVVSLALPVVAGGGAAVRAIAHADEAVDAARAVDNSLTLSKQGAEHILMGNATGGGHAARANLAGAMGPEGSGQFVIQAKPGKTYFDASLSDAEILSGAERIANDPASYAKGFIPVGKTPKSRYEATGAIGAQRVKVIVEPQGKGIVTAYPVKEPK